MGIILYQPYVIHFEAVTNMSAISGLASGREEENEVSRLRIRVIIMLLNHYHLSTAVASHETMMVEAFVILKIGLLTNIPIAQGQRIVANPSGRGLVEPCRSGGYTSSVNPSIFILPSALQQEGHRSPITTLIVLHTLAHVSLRDHVALLYLRIIIEI